MAEAFLGVEASLTGRRWLGPSLTQERAAEHLAQATAEPPALCQVLARLGVAAPNVPDYLEPKLRDLMPDPRGMRDCEAAAARINQAVDHGERIAIFADYDVDGAASAAVLMWWLRALGQRATIYVPDRLEEGYGPNAPAISELAKTHDLIITVDCGTLSHEALAAANGCDVVVLDHHLGGETLPPALAVVNPNRQDESGELKHLCAAAVVFLTLVEANRQRRQAGKTTPNLMELLDFVGLATVADVAPLVGVNRAFVRQGLKVMSARQHPGLRALADVAGLHTAPTSYHLGFLLGPRINAGGRIGKSDLGARLLSSEDPNEALAIAERLHALNAERQQIEELVREAALAQAETRNTPGLAWAAGEGWHAGVVGIVASRLKDRMHSPAVVIGFDGETGVGSARSVPGIDLGNAVHRLAQEGLIMRGGGHKMAAGLSLTRKQLEPAMARLEALLTAQGAGGTGPGDLVLDGMLTPRAASVDLIDMIEQAGPFGASVPAPRFAFPDLEIAYVKPVGTNHLKITARNTMGDRIETIAFNMADGPIGAELRPGKRAHLAGQLDKNTWQGRTSVQLRLSDAALT